MKNNGIVFIFMNVPWMWSTDYPNQTAKTLIKKGYIVVCYYYDQSYSINEILVNQYKFEWFSIIQQGLYALYPIHIIPFKRFKIIYYANFWLNIIIFIFYIYFTHPRMFAQMHKPILWFFSPFLRITHMCKVFFTVFYDCVDYFRGGLFFSISEKKQVIPDENCLIASAHYMFVNSVVLKKLHNKRRKDIYVVPQGFRLDSFIKKPQLPFVIPRDKPVIGYVGGLNYRLDFKLLKQLAKRNISYTFVLIGPILDETQKDNVMRQLLYLSLYPNVIIYPNVSKKYVPGVISQFDIGMIPYDMSIHFNRYCYPMKLFEYFYLGKPVLSTPIEELKRFPQYVFIGRNSTEWGKLLRELTKNPWTQTYKTDERRLAIENSWTKKIETILSIYNRHTYV